MRPWYPDICEHVKALRRPPAFVEDELREARIRAALPEMATHEVPLASVLLSLKQSPVAPVAVNNDPPTIFYADRPASLVVFDREPVLVPAGKSDLSFAAKSVSLLRRSLFNV